MCLDLENKIHINIHYTCVNELSACQIPCIYRDELEYCNKLSKCIQVTSYFWADDFSELSLFYLFLASRYISYSLTLASWKM